MRKATKCCWIRLTANMVAIYWPIFPNELLNWILFLANDVKLLTRKGNLVATSFWHSIHGIATHTHYHTFNGSFHWFSYILKMLAFRNRHASNIVINTISAVSFYECHEWGERLPSFPYYWSFKELLYLMLQRVDISINSEISLADTGFARIQHIEHSWCAPIFNILFKCFQEILQK